MAYHKTHEGEFAGRDGTLWRVELLENTDTAPATAGVLTFEADEPLLLEWEERGKEEVIQGCMATLRVESPGDRTYEGLYSVEACRIRMDVYRDGRLYWQGTLDTEFYEEPYERASLYPVSLKFSDFGVMDRLKYDLSGMQTVGDILTYCLGRAGLEADIDQTLISTALPGQASPLTLDALSVRSDNFYDEDGEASTLEEVIELILENTLTTREELVRRHNMHRLSGAWAGSNGRHVCNAGDWLLVWAIRDELVVFQRTGTHREIFR